MTINRVEYLMILSALTETEIFINVASDWRLSHAEVVSAANRLFQSGDILAAFSNENGENIRGVALTISQIWASLNGKLNAFYYLTSQGGARWEGLTGANWNYYHKWCLGYQRDEITGLFRSEIICCSQQIMQEIINYCEYLENQILISETCFWEDIGFWKATYWKTLPKAYKVTYQHRYFELCIDSNTPKEWIEKDRQAKQWYSEISHWYTEPELDTNPSSLFEDIAPISYAALAETPNSKVEYLLLKSVVINYYGLESVAYSEHLSHAETALAADSLFQKGDIKAIVFADEYDAEGTPDVVLTMAGIQDHLDGRLKASYYLTPQGGAKWEAMAHPAWNKFLIANFLNIFPYEEGIIGTEREIIEQLLAVDSLILIHEHISGTEKWNVLEPFQATYWKTLPRGYHVSCEHKSSDFCPWKLDDNTPAEIVEEYQRASQWYENVKKWYTDPSFD
ncbi:MULTISPECIES: hypothetical protein [unclassified Microcoleus]|uniref:hypothetical protein n=1 Tax=unclassified Microcoleus TaxID=2642155 RepID=UPI002FD45604